MRFDATTCGCRLCVPNSSSLCVQFVAPGGDHAHAISLVRTGVSLACARTGDARLQKWVSEREIRLAERDLLMACKEPQEMDTVVPDAIAVLDDGSRTIVVAVVVVLGSGWGAAGFLDRFSAHDHLLCHGLAVDSLLVCALGLQRLRPVTLLLARRTTLRHRTYLQDLSRLRHDLIIRECATVDTLGEPDPFSQSLLARIRTVQGSPASSGIGANH